VLAGFDHTAGESFSGRWGGLGDTPLGDERHAAARNAQFGQLLDQPLLPLALGTRRERQ